MRITKDQIVAGHPTIRVRDFLRRYRLSTFKTSAAERALDLARKRASEFLIELSALGLIEPTKPFGEDTGPAFRVSSAGHAFANASAAKPISRKTAERVLGEFLERVDAVNSTEEYVYRVQNAVLFGSMLSSMERLGDVDVAIDLQPKVTEDTQFQQRCDARRHAAQEGGRSLRTTFDWAMWPRIEILLRLKARSRSLSLHEFDEVMQMDDVQYSVLVGDPKRIASLIPRGRPV
jgi:hypothetical protein